jgi:hypothetical protein
MEVEEAVGVLVGSWDTVGVDPGWRDDVDDAVDEFNVPAAVVNPAVVVVAEQAAVRDRGLAAVLPMDPVMTQLRSVMGQVICRLYVAGRPYSGLHRAERRCAAGGLTAHIGRGRPGRERQTWIGSPSRGRR